MKDKGIQTENDLFWEVFHYERYSKQYDMFQRELVEHQLKEWQRIYQSKGDNDLLCTEL